MSKVQILIVEDEALVRDLLKLMVAKLGYGVVGTVSSARQAMAAIGSPPPDLILMDIGLPGGVDGIATVEQIQAQFDIPIIYVSGFFDEKTLARAEVTMPYGYLQKPINATQLHAAIKMALHKHQVEKQMRANEARLRNLINATPDIICFKDHEGRWQDANNAMCDIFELHDIDYQGKTDLELAELRPRFGDALRYCYETDARAWESQGSSRAEEIIPGQDGTPRIFDVIKVPLWHTNGRPNGLVILGREMTEQKQAARKIEESEKRYRHLFENAGDAIYILSMDGRIIDTNQLGITQLGYSRTELLTKTPYDIDTDADESHVVRRMDKILISGAHNFESIHRRKDGTTFPVEITAQRLDYGSQPAIMCIIRDISARKAREAQYRVMFDHSPLGMVYHDRDGTILACNTRVGEIMGTASDQYIGVNPLRDDPIPESLHGLKEAMAGRRARYEGEHKSIVGDKTRYLRVIYNPIDADSPPCQVISTFEDLTDQVRQQAQYQAIFEHSPMGIVQLDKNGTAIACNQKFAEIFGGTPEQFVGLDVINGIKDPEMVRAIKRAQSGNTGKFEGPYTSIVTRVSGHIRALFNPLNTRQTPCEIIGTFEDISDQVAAENAKRQSEQNYRQIFNSVNDAVFVHDGDTGQILHANQAVIEMYGFTLEELRHIDPGRTSLNRPPYTAVEAKAMIEKAKETGKHTFEWHARHKTGTLFWVEVTLSPAVIDGQSRLLAVVRDISEKKAAEKQLIQSKEAAEQAKQFAESANRAKSNFLATMSHELRTPLHQIMGFADLLKEPAIGVLNEDQREYIDDIKLSSHHLLRMINEILDVSKIEAGLLDISLELTNPRELLSAKLAQFNAATQAEDLTLNASIDELPPQIHTDPHRLKQVVHNLLANAVKFTPAGGTITFSAGTIPTEGLADLPGAETAAAWALTSTAAQWVHIAVTDSGIGIETQDLARVFQIFEQADTSLNREYEGAGIGLAIAQQIVRQLGGHIWVVSGGRNQGATFQFILPTS